MAARPSYTVAPGSPSRTQQRAAVSIISRRALPPLPGLFFVDACTRAVCDPLRCPCRDYPYERENGVWTDDRPALVRAARREFGLHGLQRGVALQQAPGMTTSAQPRAAAAWQLPLMTARKCSGSKAGTPGNRRAKGAGRLRPPAPLSGFAAPAGTPGSSRRSRAGPLARARGRP